jgi:hypothetical protein
MKVAHLILAHAYPQMLERLVKKLLHPSADIYIQLDKKTDMLAFAHLATIENVQFVDKRIKTEWGDYSLVEATLTGFKYILDTGLTYSHINLLSGQDYPIRPLDEFHDFLVRNLDTSFIKAVDLRGDEWPDGKDRLIKYSLGDYRLPGKYKWQTLANKFLPRRQLPASLIPYGRSQWLTITPECAQYAIGVIQNDAALRRYFRMTWAVDEIFFQTILFNSPLKEKLINDNLRYIEQFGAKRPNIFTLKDAPKLIASGCFFARKFDDEADMLVYEALDSNVVGH